MEDVQALIRAKTKILLGVGQAESIALGALIGILAYRPVVTFNQSTFAVRGFSHEQAASFSKYVTWVMIAFLALAAGAIWDRATAGIVRKHWGESTRTNKTLLNLAVYTTAGSAILLGVLPAGLAWLCIAPH